MKRLFTIAIIAIVYSVVSNAANWDYIKASGEYYYGVGMGATQAEADSVALADLISKIAVDVSSYFEEIDDVAIRNGNIEHASRVLNCVKTYSSATLTNTEMMVVGEEPEIVVRRYLKKSELTRIYESRIEKAKSMLKIADNCLAQRKIDMALQYYYWAYSLIRSVQYPNEVKDEQGNVLVATIPVKIDEILRDIKVQHIGNNGDFTDFSFMYQNFPVSSLEFSYSDGRADCQGLVKDGRGVIEMLPGYVTDVYHIDIEFEYKSQARGDVEMQNVLDVITPKVFPSSSFKVNVQKPIQNAVAKVGQDEDSLEIEAIAEPVVAMSQGNEADKIIQLNVINQIVKAITNKRYFDASSCFTVNGLQIFNRLTSYGRARVLDPSNVKFYRGLGGKTVVRGLKMSFSFNGRRKKTFVEEVSFTFNAENKIDNVAFGLGKYAEDGIFNSQAQWNYEVREIIVSFMENYKTAYSLERIDYLEDIFADDALIIVGNVVRRNTMRSRDLDGQISLNGQKLISYNRYTKEGYINHLRKCFNRNDFINLKFTNHEIQWLEKFDNEKLFAINIRQQYNSSTYADDGYLFLLVDMTNIDEPLIQIRTWQPNEVSIDKLYNAGDFFGD